MNETQQKAENHEAKYIEIQSMHIMFSRLYQGNSQTKAFNTVDSIQMIIFTKPPSMTGIKTSSKENPH